MSALPNGLSFRIFVA